MSPVPARTTLGLDADRYVAAHGFDLSLSSDVVVVYDMNLVPTQPLGRRLLERLRPGRAHHPFRAVRPCGEGVDVVVAAGPGAPVAAVTVELLATFGARRVVSVGTAAGDHRTRLGRVLVVDAADDPDGLFPCPDGEPSARSGLLFDRLAARSDGVVSAHTTLWPFRVGAGAIVPTAETDATPTVIEMEARALFTVGDRIGLEVQAVVATSDRFDEAGRWVLGRTTDTQAALSRAVDLATNSLISTRAGGDPVRAPCDTRGGAS